MIERLSQLLLRLRTYDWWVILIEMAVIWSVVYLIVRFLRGTRGAGKPLQGQHHRDHGDPVDRVVE